MDQLIEFAPLFAGIALMIFVPILELPFRRFAFPFLWAALGILVARAVTAGVMAWLDVEGLKPETLILFQSATVLAVGAIAVGEWLRRAGFHWRALVASLGILSVAMTMLATHVLNGGGPRVYFLGKVLVWVSVAGYVIGPSALAALVYLLGVHRRELEEELGR